MATLDTFQTSPRLATRRSRRGAVIALVIAVSGLTSPTYARGERPGDTTRQTNTVVRRGSEIVFHGWSRDSKYVAYTRHRFIVRPEHIERQRMHRQVLGGAFTGFGTKVGGDVELHAQRSGYVVAPLPWRRTSETALELRFGERLLHLEMDVGRNHGWRLREGERIIANHRFDRIYVGFRAELYPSPDGRQAIVVMHLDSGWDIDAAAWPVELAHPKDLAGTAESDPSRQSPAPPEDAVTVPSLPEE